jgi:uncharacterized protein YbbC (DUF1343 family)
MEACAENNLPLIVLDRPNPIGGNYVDGPVTNKEYFSFAGITKIPITYGMTTGEIAGLFKDEINKKFSSMLNLTVIKMQNWEREMYFDECGLPWVPTSPNIPNLETAIVYPGVCFLEGTNISEGRGTNSPFLTLGAPFINSSDLINSLESQNIPGIKFNPIKFTPVHLTGKAENPKYENQECRGIKLEVTERKKFESVKFGIRLLYSLHKLYPEKFKFNSNNYIDLLFGDSYLREMILDENTPNEIISRWKVDLTQFKKLRQKYLLYN